MRNRSQSTHNNVSNFKSLKGTILAWWLKFSKINLAGLMFYPCQLIKGWLISSGHRAQLNRISKGHLLRSICIITLSTIEKSQEKTICLQISAVCAIIMQKMSMISFHWRFMYLSVLGKHKKISMSHSRNLMLYLLRLKSIRIRFSKK
jgi:hypothetical protein